EKSFVTDQFRKLIEVCCSFKQGPSLPAKATPTDVDAMRRAAEVTKDGEPLGDIIDQFEQHVMQFSLNFGSRTFLAHPDCGNSVAAVAGDLASAFLQQNLASKEFSPMATDLELQLLQQLRKLTGFPCRENGRYASDAGGAFVFGGSNANYSCLLAARENLRARLAKENRIYEPRRVRVLGNRPFTHYSLRRSLYMLGLGNRDLTAAQRTDLGLEEEALCDVETKNFRMDTGDLPRQIERVLSRGEEIMCIFAVAGDSRMMAFDDLRTITDIAARYGLWVHVDTCQGCQCLFSPNRSHLHDGLEAAQSVSLDPHKVLMVPYNLSLFFLHDPSHLSYVTSGATVIKMGEESFGSFTPVIGSKSFMALKLWFMLKHFGWARLASEIDHRHELALQASTIVRDHPDLVLINSEVQHNAVAFMYRPPGDRWRDTSALNELNQEIHRKLNHETEYFLHTFPAQDDENAVSDSRATIHPLRMMFGNPDNTFDIVRDCLDAVIAIGNDTASRHS
ncbi:MAG: pyridoxal-dependent decarboxylase, partial [candidate division Zixibacteria bacterium]|nr:pyridoxal-dependent decarboxylase [candidate division Zixibacteria bacterium]